MMHVHGSTLLGDVYLANILAFYKFYLKLCNKFAHIWSFVICAEELYAQLLFIQAKLGNKMMRQTVSRTADKDFGTLEVVADSRCRKFTFRLKEYGGILTTPPYAVSEAIAWLNSKRETIAQKLKEKKEKEEKKGRRKIKLLPRIFGADTDFSVQGYKLSIEFSWLIEEGHAKARIEDQKKAIKIFFNPSTRLETADVQDTIRKLLDGAMKHMATVLFTPRLQRLAQMHNFQYNGLSIHTTTSKWGSCNSSRKINLSCYLLLLPDHLIEHVMLHELCHTVEMNHGPRFHALLDTVTQGKGKENEKELNRYLI